MKKLLAFFPLRRNNVRWGTATLMTSSNDNKDSALPHAASHLVLYANLKREKKQQTKRRERAEEKRRRKEQEGSGFWGGDGGASGGSRSELADPFGPLWCPSLSGGQVGVSGLWSKPASSLGFLSVLYVFIVCGLFLQLLNYQTHGSYCLSPLKIYWVKFFSPLQTFNRLFPFSDGFSTPGLLIGTCMNWTSVRSLQIHSQSAPHVATRWHWAVVFIHSICLQVWLFLCKVYALRLPERCTSWDSDASLGAQLGLLWGWQRVFFTLSILLLFLLLVIIIIRIVHKSHQTSLKQKRDTQFAETAIIICRHVSTLLSL